MFSRGHICKYVHLKSPTTSRNEFGSLGRSHGEAGDSDSSSLLLSSSAVLPPPLSTSAIPHSPCSRTAMLPHSSPPVVPSPSSATLGTRAFVKMQIGEVTAAKAAMMKFSNMSCKNQLVCGDEHTPITLNHSSFSHGSSFVTNL